jgi:Flp pilus assembly protein TadB
MDNLNDLKTIWLTAKTDCLPTADEMVRTMKTYRNRKLLKKAALTAIAILLVALLVLTAIYYPSTMATTRIGEACMLVAAIILLSSNINSLKRAYKLKNCTNKECVEHLESGQRGRIRFYRKTQLIAFAFVSIGLLLYLYEMVYQNLAMSIIVYSVTIVWLLINWLVVRPRAFKRQTKKFNEAMEKIEKLSKQF